MTFYRLYPWVLPAFLLIGSLGFALVVWSQCQPGRVRRLATTFALVLALAVGTMQIAPQLWTDVCRFDPFLLECWLPY